jgi:hypothetical protein
MNLSKESRLVAGITLLTIPTIEYGGSFLLNSLTDPMYVANPLRHDLFRAGHAHAGVLVILSLILQPLIDQAILPSALKWIARLGAPLAAVLVSAGFFLSALSPSTLQPGRAIALVYLGAVLIAFCVLSTGVGLIRSSTRGAQRLS